MIIGFIGAGSMGGALIEGFIKSGIEYTNIIASVKTMERKDYLENLVTECVISEMSKPEVLDRLVKKLLQVQDRQTKENTALSLLIKERKKTQTALAPASAVVARVRQRTPAIPERRAPLCAA